MQDNDKIGHDSDTDDRVDAFWSDVQAGKKKLSGKVITQEEYDRWRAESDEARKRAKDGDSGEVQPH